MMVRAKTTAERVAAKLSVYACATLFIKPKLMHITGK
jgi:hypothetical protein